MKPAGDRTLQTIAILGTGFEGTLAAAWLAHSCHGTGIRVRLVPAACAEAGDFAYCALPARPDDLLGPLGISDLTLLNECNSSFALGIRLGPHILPFGAVGMDFAGTDFHHHWLMTGRQEPYFAYSPAWQAMQGDQFAPPIARNAIGSLQHEVTRLVDVSALTALLTRQLNSRGVDLTAPLDTPGDAVGESGSLTLADGTSLDADLVVDARGALQTEPAKWLQAPSVDDSMAGAPTYALSDDAVGWQLIFPLANQTWKTRVPYDRAPVDPTPWQGRVVRIGAAAHSLLPLLPWYTSVLMRSIRRLADWLPPTNDPSAHRRAFNQQSSADFAALRTANALVESALGRPSDDTPDGALALWHKRGLWHDPDSTLLNRWDWISLLIALDHVPQNHDPLAERLPAEARAKHCARLRAEIVRVTAGFPKLSDYLAAANQAGP